MKEVVGQNSFEYEQLELDQLLPEQPESVVPPRRKRRNPGRLATIAVSFVLAACNASVGGTPVSPDTSLTGNTSGGDNSGKLNLLFPFQDTWYLTGGPHSDGLSNNVRYALDFAPKAILPCPGSGPLATETVTASESGKVVVVGNENDSTDPNHSVVKIEDAQGFDVGYMHLADITVKVGQEVNADDPLGNPSCETSPGGQTTGIHVHEFLEKGGQPLPITDVTFDGLVVNAGNNNYQGALTGEKTVTADVGRFTEKNPGPGGIVNEVSNSGTAETQAATPKQTKTPTPAENPTATPEAVSQSPENLVRSAFLTEWLSTFSGKPVEGRSSEYPDLYNYALVEAENMDAWKHNIPTLLAGGKSDTPLLIKYQLGQSIMGGAISKISGEVQITNMSLMVAAGEISDFQKNTGVGFIGLVQLNADTAYRSNWSTQGLFNNLSEKAQEAWIKKVDNSPLPSAFSDVQPGSVESSYTIKNGKPIDSDHEGMWPIYGQAAPVHLPTSVMLPEQESCQVGYDVAPCQWLQLK